MRRRRQTAFLNPIKHASTLVDNTGSGVGSFFGHQIYRTQVGARADTGAVVTIQNSKNTEDFLNVGDVVKYVNICLEACPRGANPTNDNDNCAWLEWAVVWERELNRPPTVANIGVLTLGVVCSHVFRENCLMTGCFPLGTKQAMSQDIKIKLPTRCCKLKMGDRLTCYCYVRTSVTTDARTDSHRLIASSHFKAYN